MTVFVLKKNHFIDYLCYLFQPWSCMLKKKTFLLKKIKKTCWAAKENARFVRRLCQKHLLLSCFIILHSPANSYWLTSYQAWVSVYIGPWMCPYFVGYVGVCVSHIKSSLPLPGKQEAALTTHERMCVCVNAGICKSRLLCAGLREWAFILLFILLYVVSLCIHLHSCNAAYYRPAALSFTFKISKV